LRRAAHEFSACRCPRQKFKAFDDHTFAIRQTDNLCHFAPALPAHRCHVAILEVAKKKIRTVGENCFQFLDTVLHFQKQYGTIQASGARDIVTPYLKASRACCSQAFVDVFQFCSCKAYAAVAESNCGKHVGDFKEP
jgi:hypothetical protein